MPTAGPRLDRLPAEILQHISSYCDEQSLWSMSATCRAVRAGGAIALEAFLTEQSVVPWPPMVTSSEHTASTAVLVLTAVYQPIDPSFIPIASQPRDTRRVFLLQRKVALFDRYLRTNAACAVLIRKLAVEVIDIHPEWSQVIELAPQLTSLTIMVMDGARAETVRRDDTTHTVPIADIWPFYPREPQLLFPNLTHLNLCVTARIFIHLNQIAGRLPALRELVLSQHFELAPLDQDCLETRERVAATEFPSLERLTITGHGTVLCAAIDVMLRRSRSIRYITLHLSPQFFPLPIEMLLLHVGPVAQHRPLLGLALLGPHAIGLLCALQLRQIIYINFDFLPTLKVLALERPATYRLNHPADDQLDYSMNGHPFLYDVSSPGSRADCQTKLNISNLERLVLVDQVPLDPANPAHPQAIPANNIFKPCESFKGAVRVVGYPLDPFADDLESEPMELEEEDWPM